jgi:hypothetical protein
VHEICTGLLNCIYPFSCFIFVTLIILQTLVKKYSSSLGISVDSCLAALLELQQHALDRLRERDRFKETGLATIRVRVPDKNHSRRVIPLEIKLSATVQELQQEVASQVGVEFDRYFSFVLTLLFIISVHLKMRSA